MCVGWVGVCVGGRPGDVERENQGKGACVQRWIWDVAHRRRVVGAVGALHMRSHRGVMYMCHSAHV